MRQRIEDLGRIMVMVKQLTDHDLFEERPSRNKEFLDYFEKLTKDQQEEWLHKTIYQIAGVEEKLYEIWEIATGQDYLNEPRE